MNELIVQVPQDTIAHRQLIWTEKRKRRYAVYYALAQKQIAMRHFERVRRYNVETNNMMDVMCRSYQVYIQDMNALVADIERLEVEDDTAFYETIADVVLVLLCVMAIIGLMAGAHMARVL